MATIPKKPVAKPAAKAAPAKTAPAKTAAAKTAVGVKKPFPARKPGTAAKPATARPAKIVFKAPADFKPAFFEVEFSTLRDGLLNGSSVKINRVRGNWTNEDAKRYNLAEYDLPTFNAIVARLGSIYAPNVLKRLPTQAKFGIILRCNRKAADGTLAVGVKGIKQLVKNEKTQKSKWVWFEDKKDVTYRKIRKITNILPGAFIAVQLPPAGRQPKKAAEE